MRLITPPPNVAGKLKSDILGNVTTQISNVYDKKKGGQMGIALLYS